MESEGPPAFSWPLCTCGTYAIGECSSCHTPVCGDDSDRKDGTRLCTRCLRRAQAATVTTSAAARAAQAQTAARLHDDRVSANEAAKGPSAHVIAALNDLDARARAASAAERLEFLTQYRALREHLRCGDARCPDSDCQAAWSQLT